MEDCSNQSRDEGLFKPIQGWRIVQTNPGMKDCLNQSRDGGLFKPIQDGDGGLFKPIQDGDGGLFKVQTNRYIR
jgi:hypothetical protein